MFKKKIEKNILKNRQTQEKKDITSAPKYKKNSSLYMSVVTLALAPVLILGVIVLVTVYSTLSTRTDKDVSDNLKSTARTILIAYNQNPGDYYIGEDGNLWKGSFNVNRSQELLASIGNAADVDIYVYTKETFVVSNVEGEHEVPKDIEKIVLDKSLDYYSTNYNFEGTQSYVYGIRIVDERTEKTIGMLVISSSRKSRTVTYNTVIKYTVVTVIVLLIVVGIVSMIISRRLVLAMQDGIKNIQQLSSGDLNIGCNDTYLKRRDEVGSMHRSVSILVGNLREMIRNSISQTNKLILSSENLDKTASKTKESILQVNDAMDVMANTAIAQANTSNKVINNINVLRRMIEDTYEDIKNLNYTKNNMQGEGKKVEQVISNLNYINTSLNEIINVINTQVETTYKSATKIKNSAELISEFADETNLLALNAAIEAARVGEQGKGFAIVAEQIKKLADQSNDVSMNISKDIGELVNDSNKSMVSMEKVNAIIDKLNENIQTTEDVFEQINVGIDDFSICVEKIENSMDKMDIAGTSIRDVTDELSEIAKQNSECAEKTTSVTDYMTELFEEARELKHVSDDLAETMNVFKL